MTGLGLGVGAAVAKGIADAKAADPVVDAEGSEGAVTAGGAGDAELPQPTRDIPKKPASNRELRRMLLTTDGRPFAGRRHSTAVHRGRYTDAVSSMSAPVGPDRLAAWDGIASLLLMKAQTRTFSVFALNAHTSSSCG